jgi:hypothetical protein
MRRVIAFAAAGMTLAGCSSFSTDSLTDYFKSTPPTVQLQLESTPPGAEARTSIGPGCKTPCAVTLAAPEGGFTVSYSLARFEPASVPVQVTRIPGDLLHSATIKVDPNPVVAELQATPPKGGKPMRPKRVKQLTTNTAAAPAAAASPFLNPGQGVPPPPGLTR